MVKIVWFGLVESDWVWLNLIWFGWGLLNLVWYGWGWLNLVWFDWILFDLVVSILVWLQLVESGLVWLNLVWFGCHWKLIRRRRSNSIYTTVTTLWPCCSSMSDLLHMCKESKFIQLDLKNSKRFCSFKYLFNKKVMIKSIYNFNFICILL